jgi:hypothetical protein
MTDQSADIAPGVRTMAQDKQRRNVRLVIIIALGIVAYVALGPYLAVRGIQNGLASNNPDLLAEHVDFPVLRQNLKDQFNAQLAKAGIGSTTATDKMSQGFAALGALMATKMIDGMVEAYVTPSGLANLAAGRSSPAIVKEITPGDAERKNALSDADWQIESLSRISLIAGTPTSPENLRFVLTRDGLTWKLTNVILPLR